MLVSFWMLSEAMKANSRRTQAVTVWVSWLVFFQQGKMSHLVGECARMRGTGDYVQEELDARALSAAAPPRVDSSSQRESFCRTLGR